MPLLTPSETTFAQAISKLVGCNHFLPERIDYERQALGPDFSTEGAVWSARPRDEGERGNVLKLQQRVEQLVTRLRDALSQHTPATREDYRLYEDLVMYLLYYHYYARFDEVLGTGSAKPKSPRTTPKNTGRGSDVVVFWDDFVADVERYLHLPGMREAGFRNVDEPAHIFAIFYQIRRAFGAIFTAMVGSSLPMAKLRAAVWESIFTHDIRRYRRALFAHMGDMATLITGESGTGKELVARSIALARYIPFDIKRQRFVEDYQAGFLPLNLSALSPTLIESELFGHRRGAFTGALEDRAGWLEVCPPLGTVFLDEIGELDAQIQVKLLRVLQDRIFQRLGDTTPRHFAGKIVAATNRNLPQELQAQRFREDLYYRLCGDIIHMPTLREQLAAGGPKELHDLVQFIAQRVAGEEADSLAQDVISWIEKNMPPHYPWPGNFRELEQCVRNVLIRKEYRPSTHTNTDANFLTRVQHGQFTVDQLVTEYVRRDYARTHSYEETGRRLALDRRTVKAKITDTSSD